MKAGLLGMLLLTLVTTATVSQAQLDELIARAKSFELDTPYVPPPGEPLTHHAADYRRVCAGQHTFEGRSVDQN